MSSGAAEVEHLWRADAPQVLAALLRRYGDFDRAEDAVQEALLAAATQWPADGTPDDPRAWLIRVASRRLIDRWRSDSARADRELEAWRKEVDTPESTEPADFEESLALLLLCCHPVLPPPGRVALTLRAVGGLSTAQIARAFLVPEPTMAQRISRAKARLRETGVSLGSLSGEELPVRVGAAMQVLYLIFTEGHTATTGTTLTDVSLAEEAIRLTRRLQAQLPVRGEVGGEASGLLALMLLNHARRDARLDDDGALVRLADQDRARWHRGEIDEGVRLVSAALPAGRVGPFQLQAAIAAVHAEAESAAATDWTQIEVLYRMLLELDPGPVVRLNHAVAVAETRGAAAGLELVEALAADQGLRRQHRVHAVRAHLLERAGRADDAARDYERAAQLATSIPEQRYLNEQVTRLRGAAPRSRR